MDKGEQRMEKPLIKGKILHKLARYGKFKASHTSIDNIQKGFPKHMRGEIKNIVNEMMREDLLIAKPTKYGKEISINLNNREKVFELIKMFLRFSK